MATLDLRHSYVILLIFFIQSNENLVHHQLSAIYDIFRIVPVHIIVGEERYEQIKNLLQKNKRKEFTACLRHGVMKGC
jgi:hypothetical protein